MTRTVHKTIEQFARQHGLAIKDVSREARSTLGLPSARARDLHHKLKPTEQRALCEAFGIEPSSETPPDDQQDAVTVAPEDIRAPTRSDPPQLIEQLSFDELPHPILLHDDVVEAVGRRPEQRKRLAVVLQHLGADGRTSRVKGCRGQHNKGWQRTPFGGNGGSQWYLWWTRYDDPPVKHLGDALAEHTRVVRAIRHHDDHSPVPELDLDDFWSVSAQDAQQGDYVDAPWTGPQRSFIESSDPVRFVLGQPGAGKTSVLWRAIETRADQRVLYLTWSRELTGVAEKRFRAFAPRTTEVVCRDFRALLGDLIGSDVPRQPLSVSRAELSDAVSHYCNTRQTVWHNNITALHAEMRAQLIGRACPDAHARTRVDGVAHCDPDDYVDARAGAFGRSNAKWVWQAFEQLGGRGLIAPLFPELAAATTALDRLLDETLPRGYETFDRVVIDEAQDLTLLDLTVIVELCRAIGRTRDHAPGLLIAGDDGQTVRPSGFSWGPLSALVSERYAVPFEQQLDENLRSPQRIAAVVDRASALYSTLSKGSRPTNQRSDAEGDHTNAYLYLVDVPTAEEAIELVEQLDQLPEVKVLSAQDTPPDWLPVEHHDTVWTPTQAKGLEYQSVVILDPGRFLAALSTDRGATGLGCDEDAIRTSIDQFRVAISRATESLTFVDVSPDPVEQARSLALLGDPVPYDAEDLVAALGDAEMDVDERVDIRIADARASLDDHPWRAWRRALQAVGLLGNPRLPGGVAAPHRRAEAHRTLIAVAARLIVEQSGAQVESHDAVEERARASLEELDSPAEMAAFVRLVDWRRHPAGNTTRLLTAATDIDERITWLRDALLSIAQTLRAALASAAEQPEHAASFAGDVSRWLALTGYTGDLASEADRLRRLAFDTLTAAEELDAAERVLDLLAPPTDRLRAVLYERGGRWADAAEYYERAGAYPDAIRCWRAVGEWHRALQLTDPASSEHRDLSWLQAFDDVLRRRPDGHATRLTPAEHDAVRDLIDRTFDERKSTA